MLFGPIAVQGWPVPRSLGDVIWYPSAITAKNAHEKSDATSLNIIKENELFVGE